VWAHRFELPAGKRPFGEFEPILRALASLDPEAKTSRYFSPSRAPDGEGVEPKETRQWIELATNLDHVSKTFIDHCLTLAAEAALDKSKEWVQLAKSAGIDDSFEFEVIRVIRDRRDLMKGRDPNAYQRRVLTDRKKKLEAFLSMASTLANDIEVRLDSLPPGSLSQVHAVKRGNIGENSNGDTATTIHSLKHRLRCRSCGKRPKTVFVDTWQD
jgi:hypothetical protein